MWQAESGWKTWLEGRLRRSCTHLLLSRCRMGSGFEGKAAILTAVPTGVFIFCNDGPPAGGTVASLSLVSAQRRITSEFPRMLGYPTWKVFNSSHLSDPLDPWSGGQLAPGVFLSGPVQLCGSASVSAVRARPWPAHGAETAPMRRHLVGRDRILVDGPI